MEDLCFTDLPCALRPEPLTLLLPSAFSLQPITSYETKKVDRTVEGQLHSIFVIPAKAGI